MRRIILSLIALALSVLVILGAVWLVKTAVRYVRYADDKVGKYDETYVYGEELVTWADNIRGMPFGVPYSEEATDVSEKNASDNATEAADETMVRIAVDSANIRSGAGTENEVLTVASQGQEFYTTGNVLPADNGSLWYEIFLDDARQTTGWASEKVIEMVE